MGAGSLGTILGAYLAKAGYDVELIDPYKEHVQALNDQGAHIVGTVDFIQPVKAIVPEEMTGIYDLVIYMAKQTYNDVAIPQIAAHIDENSIVCTCQNGIPEYAVSAAIGRERVVGAPVGWGATFRGPGVSELTTTEKANAFTLGSLSGPINDRVLKTQEVLQSFCPVHLSDNLMGLRWTKLIMNCTYSGMSTVLGCTFGEISASDDVMKLVLQIGKECIDVASALGIALEPYEGYDFYEAHRWGDASVNAASIEIIRKIWEGHEPGEASMLQDLKKGRRCEINEINGVVCKAGREHGIPTPVNDMIVKVVTAIQNGEFSFGSDNLKYFSAFLES